MNSNLRRVLVAGMLLAAVWGVGCSRDERPSAEKGTFAIVDGTPVTASDLRDAVLLRAKMAELSKRPIRAKQFATWANSCAMSILPGLVQAHVFEHALKLRGVKATAESDELMLKKYNRITRGKARTLDELAPVFGELESAFRKQFARESLMKAYAESSPETQASEQDFHDYYQEQTNLLFQCRRITEVGMKRGREAYAKLKAGESWEKVAKTYCEAGLVEPSNADNWKEWMTVPLGKLEPKELADAVGKLSEGQFTEPIDIDEGLVIVRLNARVKEYVELSRILIRLGREMEIPTRTEAEAEIRGQKWHELQRRDLEKARRDFKVEYLFTTNFSYKIWQEEPTGNKQQGKEVK